MPIKHDEERVIKANITRNLTQEQVIEIIKCSKDVKYFAENYYKVVSNEKGEHVIELRDFQKRMLDCYVANRHIISRSGRQSGKCFLENTTVEILDTNTDKVEKIKIGEFFNKIKNI